MVDYILEVIFYNERDSLIDWLMCDIACYTVWYLIY